MSIAPRETKCVRLSKPRPGQARLGQRWRTSPSGFSTGVPQRGQCAGIFHGGLRSAPSGMCGPTTCGITSPARCTITVSPMRMSLRLMSSSLCSVAIDTVTPPTTTGSSTANGLSAPVRPTLTPMSRSVVRAVVGANLKAIAQRGSRLTEPSRRCCSKLDTLTTAPSMS